MQIVIHAAPQISWQTRLAPIIQRGLKKHNIKVDITSSPTRKPKEDIAIILGPNYWKRIESDKKPFIMMNRKFLGFHERDVHDNVCISWDGFNGRGTFCVDEIDPNRIWRYIDQEDFEDWKGPGTYYLMFKQTDKGRNKKYPSINEWYVHVKRNIKPLKIRPKENPENTSMKNFRRSFKKSLEDIKAGIVLNSTVSTEVLLAGVPVISMDEGDPCYAINSHNLNEIKYPDRKPFMDYLAHCQWHYDEIENGDFWARIYPKRGTRLCEWNDENKRDV